MDNNSINGKKVFFLYPHSVLQTDMLDILIENEYEVYLVKNHQKMIKAAEKFSSSILFINIDEAMSVDDWAEYIKNMMENEKTRHVQIGIMTYNSSQELAQKFLMELMVPCGFIVLSLGLEKSSSIMLKILAANEAKGRRKYIRALALKNENTKFNVRINSFLYNGNIIDISIAGMAAVFDRVLHLEQKTQINDIQLILRGTICRVSGIIIGNRHDDENCYIILFNKIEEKSKIKIHTYIYKQLQDIMNDFFNKL